MLNPTAKSLLVIPILLSYLTGCAESSGENPFTAEEPATASPRVALTADTSTVNFNGNVTLSWTTSDVQDCVASGDWTGNKSEIGSEMISSLVADSTFILTCTEINANVGNIANRGVSATVSISVAAPATPTVSLSANPTTVVMNGSTTLTWNSTDTTDCTASGDWSGSKSTSGSQTLNGITSNRSFSLSCSGPGGNVSDSANISVTTAPPAPTLSLTASPTTVAQNGSTTLTWSSTDTTDCTASGDWFGSKSTSGSQTINAINSNKSFNLSCTGAGGSVNDTVNVTFSPVNTAPIANAGTDRNVVTGSQVTLNGSGSSDADGDPLTYAWTLTTKPSGSAAALNNSTSLQPSFMADLDGEYVISLVVNDGAVSSGSDVVEITSSSNTSNPTYPRTLVVGSYDCTDSTVHCVDDTSGANREFSTIQQAVDLAGPGDVVLVHDGNYAGFIVDNSGTQGNEILITANGNNVVVSSPNSRSGNDNIYISNSSYVIVEGFTVTNAVEYGIGSHDASANSPMQGVQVRYNTVSNSGSTNIYLSQTANSLVLANTSFNSQASHGIYLTNAGSDNVTLVANIAYQNSVNGIHFNGDGSNGGDGVHTGLVVLDNIVYSNNANGIDADGVYDSAFVNNLVYNNGRHGIRVFRIDSNLGAGNLSFINNTIVSNSDMAIKLTQDDGGHLFFNNALIDNSGGCIYVESSNIISDNNIYTNNCSFTPNNSSLFFGSASFTASATQLFSDSAGADYRLKATSPAINAGLSNLNGTSAPDADIDGINRDANVDIGAYEF